MNNEQKKVIERCKSMIKTSFSDMNGKIIFRLNSRLLGSKGIDVDMFMPNVRTEQASVGPVTEVDIR